MTARKVRWAANRPDGTPIIIDGIIANVDDTTGVVSLDERTNEVIQEIVNNEPEPVTMAMVPMADFANEVHRILQKEHGHKAISTTPKSDVTPSSDVKQSPEDPVSDLIDQALRLLYSQEYRYWLKLTGQQFRPTTVQELRDGPLGRDLFLLSKVARAEDERSPDEVFAVVDSVLELLFWPPGADYYSVPRSFWEEPLGELLSTAILQSMDTDDLITIGETASLLGVTRVSIYRWLDERALRGVRDPASNRIFIVRRDVESLLDLAHRYEEDLASEVSPETDAPRPNVLILPQPQRSGKDRSERERKSLSG